MAGRLRLLILCGGRSAEHEVSLTSARSVLQVLDPQRYEVRVVGITRGGRWILDPELETALRRGLVSIEDEQWDSVPWLEGLLQVFDRRLAEPHSRPTVVFPLLHGPFGEDGTVQGLLEILGVPYVGAGVLGSALGMDKAVTKDLLQAFRIPVVPYLVFRENAGLSLRQMAEEITSQLPFPVFVKPVNLGSSVGISKVKEPEALEPALELAFQYDSRVIVEQGVEPAREIEVSVLEGSPPEVSVPGEIVPSREFYDYEAKYLDAGSRLLIPAPLEEEQVHRVQELAQLTFMVLNLEGMARVDFLMNAETGQVFVNEVNTIPGFTPISMYPKLWEASGLPYAQLIDRLITLALERFERRRRKAVHWQVGGKEHGPDRGDTPGDAGD